MENIIVIRLDIYFLNLINKLVNEQLCYEPLLQKYI